MVRRRKMILENLTGWNEVGAHCFSIKMGGVHVVLDSGIHPKREGLASLPDFDRLGRGSVDAIFVSHAHLDHLGAVPVLNEREPQAVTYMTPATLAVGEAMLHNAVNVMSSKRLEDGIVEYPLFGHKELDSYVEQWETHNLGETFSVADSRTLKATFYSAGHILGAAGTLLEADGHRLLYTGDVNFEQQTMIPAADLPIKKINTLIMECTRGAVPRRPDYTRGGEERRFAQYIQETLDRGGIVLVPVFALGKTQEVLAMIHGFKEKNWVTANAPVYIGGLSTKVTQIVDRFADATPRTMPGFRLSEEVEYIVAGGKKRNRGEFKCQPGGIYVLSSGMMMEKTLSNKVANQVLPNPINSVLFVGYCDPDSPAGALRLASHGDKVFMSKHAPAIPFRCTLESFDFSGHASRDQLVAYAKSVSPERLFLVHGDQDALDWMLETCTQELPNTEVFIADHNYRYEFE